MIANTQSLATYRENTNKEVIYVSTKPIIFGINGYRLTEQEKILFSNHKIAGFILFKRNIQDKEQLTQLIQELKSLYSDYKPLIFVDQEGGRVARLKPPLVSELYPPAEHFSKLYDQEGSKKASEAVFSNYSSLMYSLKQLGIDSPCAPVADLLYPYAHNVIGDRSFGDSVPKVVALCTEAIKAIQEKEGVPIVKHMPGHGRAKQDSHDDLPRVIDSIEELNKTDFEVFRQLAKSNDNIWGMTAHIVFDVLDPELPVTLSEKAIKFIRQEIGFKGKLVTDAIEMGALHGQIGKQYSHAIKNRNEISDQKFHEIKAKYVESMGKVAAASLKAGCDYVLHCSGDYAEMGEVVKMLGEW